MHERPPFHVRQAKRLTWVLHTIQRQQPFKRPATTVWCITLTAYRVRGTLNADATVVSSPSDISPFTLVILPP